MNKEIKEKYEVNILSNSILDNTTYKPTLERRKQLLDYITNLEQKVDRLLKTQEMYENRCNKIHEYITQNCEIIRHENEGYDEVGKVNGGHILTLLAGGDEE